MAKIPSLRVPAEPAAANRAQRDREEEFSSLTREWSEETAFLSSTQKIAMHPAYQRIIGMGREALPLIFRDLGNRQVLWFWALRAITGTNPVPENATTEDGVQAWLQWEADHG
ncbi:MAG: hypothetical protein ACRDIE_01790, partial [Chloroflexota bacterium]